MQARIVCILNDFLLEINNETFSMYRSLEVFVFTVFLAVCLTGAKDLKLLSDSNEYKVRAPTIFLPIIARNVEHTLPNWLGYLEKLDYPKNRIFIW